MRYRSFTVILSIAAFAVAAPASAASMKLVKPPHAIEGEYLVAFEKATLPSQVANVANRVANAHNAKVAKVWSSAVLKGMLVRMNENQAQAMLHHPDVVHIQQNARMFLSESQQTFVDPMNCDPTVSNCTSQTDNRLWHLDRIGQSWATNDDQYTYCTTGMDVKIFVVDTGVMGQHQEFLNPDGTSRVTTGADFSGDDAGFPANNPCGGWPVDPGIYGKTEEISNYREQITNAAHGTSVASVAAGKRVGVAKDATIVPVKTAKCQPYSAREVKRNEYYTAGTLVLAYNGSGQAVGTYKASNSGLTASTNPWHSDTGSPTMVDNQVTWLKITTGTIQTVDMVISGLQWIYDQVCDTVGSDPCGTKLNRPAVVTMSTFRVPEDPNEDQTKLDLMEDLVKDIVAAGVPFMASANNQNANACDTSPARLSRADASIADNVFTIGGSMRFNIHDTIDSTQVPTSDQPNGKDVGQSGGALEPAYAAAQPTLDRRWVCGAGDTTPCPTTTPPSPTDPTYAGYAGGSNGGNCVTIFAPAKNITLAGLVSSSNYRDPRRRGSRLSGTSWAAPIAAGLVARLLEGTGSSMSVAAVHQALMNNAATLDSTDLNPPGVTGTPDKLLNLKQLTVSGPNDATGAATLSVSASGPGALTYQWYRVNSSFSLTSPQYRRGDATSTKLTGETSSTLSVSNPSARTGYWVRVSNGCSQVESDIAIVDPGSSLTAPANFLATRSGSQIAVQWSAVSGADSYKVEQKLPGSAWAAHQTFSGGSTTSGNIALPSGTTAAVALYRVKAVAGSSESSASTADAALLTAFAVTDFVTTSTPIDAQIVIDLREFVNAICSAADAGPQFTAAEIGATGLAALRNTPVDADIFTTLFSKLNVARNLASAPAVTWTIEPAEGVRIWASVPENLRDGIR